jgi:hypothetical protein
MSPQQLDDLVAPIALYPDPLVGEVLAASTYPMEVAEAEQWVRDHTHWKFNVVQRSFSRGQRRFGACDLQARNDGPRL